MTLTQTHRASRGGSAHSSVAHGGVAHSSIAGSDSRRAARTKVPFPAKVELFNGVQMTPTTYAEAVETCIAAARAKQPALCAFAANHILAMAAKEPEFRSRMNQFDLVAPDGQPVRWAMNYFHRSGLTDRVYGPEFTRRMCQAAAEAGVSVYFYGSTDEVIQKLCANLKEMFPSLQIAGAESPPFRPLTAEEDAAVVKRINESGAGLLFIGIGAPKQENFAFAHRDQIIPVQLCVGAAFDFHAGVKETAPRWMQKRGLEWLYRLVKEPKRLWKRYLVTNSVYLGLFAKHAFLKLIRRFPSRPADARAKPATAGVLEEDALHVAA